LTGAEGSIIFKEVYDNIILMFINFNHKVNFSVACDGSKSSYGGKGSFNFYEPQKGATTEWLRSWRIGMRNYAGFVIDLLVDTAGIIGIWSCGGIWICI
jgi:glycerate kinase